MKLPFPNAAGITTVSYPWWNQMAQKDGDRLSHPYLSGFFFHFSAFGYEWLVCLAARCHVQRGLFQKQGVRQSALLFKPHWLHFSPLVFLSCLCIKRFLITNVFSSVQRLIYEILMRKICLLGDAEAHRGQFTFCFISQPGVLQKRKQNESSTEHKHRNINSEIYV